LLKGLHHRKGHTFCELGLIVLYVMPFRDIASPMKRYGPLAKIHNLRSYGLCVFGRRGRGRRTADADADFVYSADSV